MSSSLSYSAGNTDTPLLDSTIGAALRNAALRFPASEALVSLFQNQRFTYAQLDRGADNVAACLTTLGVKSGDRIAIWSANCAEWLVTHHGAARIGAIVVTVNPALRQKEAEHILDDSQACVLFAAKKFRAYSFVDALSAMLPKLPCLQHVIYFEDGSEDSGLTWTEFLSLETPEAREQAKAMEQRVTSKDPCNIQYTSGTTGRPKGALLTHHGLLNNGFFVGERQHLTEQDRICLPVPFFHCFGIGLGALAALTHGSSLILPAEGFDPKTSLAAIVSEGCTSFYGVPMMYIAMLNDREFGRHDLKSLRTGCMGGAPCPTETMRQAVDHMNMDAITVVYGMTETSPISHQSLADDDNETRVSTVGTIHPHLQAKVIDPTTRMTQPFGLAGELCIRGYSVMAGYWRNPTATSEAIDAEGWMHTGDLAVMSERGYVQIVGRIKDTVIRGGENIYPREIEEFLNGLPDVSEVYAFGVPDEKYGEEVCVWVKLKPGRSSTPDEIRFQCKGQVATYKVPRYIRIVDEFPATASGKVQRFRMRDIEVAQFDEAKRVRINS